MIKIQEQRRRYQGYESLLDSEFSSAGNSTARPDIHRETLEPENPCRIGNTGTSKSMPYCRAPRMSAPKAGQSRLLRRTLLYDLHRSMTTLLNRIGPWLVFILLMDKPLARGSSRLCCLGHYRIHLSIPLLLVAETFFQYLLDSSCPATMSFFTCINTTLSVPMSP